MADRVAVVTGANRGIGLAIAHALAEHGLHVVVGSRDESAGRAAAEAIGGEPFQLDVTRHDHVEALARRLEGGLDVLVNNAGISLDGFDAEVVRRTLAVNAWAPMVLTDRLVPLFRPGSRIVIVSSGLGDLSHVGPALARRFADPRLDRRALGSLLEEFQRDVEQGVHRQKGWPSSAYSVSKVALNAYTRLLARELQRDPRGILVNAACPGWVRTRMGGRAAPRSPEEGARTPVWLALLPEGGPTGGLFRDERPVPW